MNQIFFSSLASKFTCTSSCHVQPLHLLSCNDTCIGYIDSLLAFESSQSSGLGSYPRANSSASIVTPLAHSAYCTSVYLEASFRTRTLVAERSWVDYSHRHQAIRDCRKVYVPEPYYTLPPSIYDTCLLVFWQAVLLPLTHRQSTRAWTELICCIGADTGWGRRSSTQAQKVIICHH